MRAKKMILLREQIPLAAPLQDAIAAVRPQIEARSHQLMLSLPAEAVYVYVDRRRVAQALQRVIDNAARFTPRGGHISVLAEKEAREICLRVRDDGSGMSSEYLAKVFDLLRSVSLAGARSVFEEHGGRLEAHSAGLGKGSEFVMRLPLLPDTPTFREGFR
jgi:signal transduction histidine kinase